MWRRVRAMVSFDELSPDLIGLNSGTVPIPPPPGTLPDNHLQYVGTWYGPCTRMYENFILYRYTLSAALSVMALRYGKKN